MCGIMGHSDSLRDRKGSDFGAGWLGHPHLRIDAHTDPDSDLYARKMTPGVLTSNSDHTRSGLHEKYQIRFLDTCRLYNINSKCGFFLEKTRISSLL